jgi:casein kinase I family protein HRR25
MKLESSELCSNLPNEFSRFNLRFLPIRYFDYIKKLGFKSTPDYKYILALFEKVATKQGIKIDKKFDWIE